MHKTKKLPHTYTHKTPQNKNQNIQAIDSEGDQETSVEIIETISPEKNAVLKTETINRTLLT